jgi:preprotein translocase SecF subunit
VFVSKAMFDLMLARRRGPAGSLGIRGALRPFGALALNVSRWRVPAVALSLAVIAAGATVMGTRGLPLGIDFSGGTMVVAEFRRPGVTEEDVRQAVATLPGEEVVQRYGAVTDGRFLIRLPLLEGQQADDLEAGARQVAAAMQASSLPDFEIADRQLVSAVIGDDLQRRGIYATVASAAAIAVYIGARFRFSFAVGAVAATVHDVLVTLACLSFAGYDLSLNVTAALLTIIGYSVNDTIVVFDRVRENVRTVGGLPLDAVVDLSVNQTLSRTIITAGTTFLSVLSLYLFGGEALRGFAFTMLIGILSGTYSTVFVASTSDRPDEITQARHTRRGQVIANQNILLR